MAETIGYLGPNWQKSVGTDIGLTFNGVLNDDPQTGIMLATDKQAHQYVVIPAEQFGQVCENYDDIKSLWKDQYKPTQAQTRERTT